MLHPRSFEPKEEFEETFVGKGASIGANSTIMSGHKIGDYSLIGAGSVVTMDVPDYALVYGTGIIKGWM